MLKHDRGAIYKSIVSLDYFGNQPHFLYNSLQKHQTFLGGLMSIFVYILVGLGFFAFGKELILKESPAVISSAEYLEVPERYNLSLSNFGFFYGVQDKSYSYYVDPTIYTVDIKLLKFLTGKNPDGSVFFKDESKTLKHENCNLERHFPNFTDLFTGQDLPNLICIDPEDADSMYLTGSFGNEEFAAISISLKSCKNSTDSKIVCKPKEKIKEKLDGGFFVVNNIDTVFNPKNYTHPEKKIRRNFYTTFSLQYWKELSFYFKNIDYYTDVGFLTEDLKLDKYLVFEKNTELIDLRDTSNEFLNCFFRLSYFKDTYFRKYLKIQELVANVGGLVKGIILIVEIFFSNYGRYKYYIDLANKTYNFSTDEEDTNKVSELRNIKVNNNTFKLKNLQSIKNNNDPFNSKTSANLTKIKLTTFQFIQIMCPFCISKSNRKVIFAEKVVREIKSKSDIDELLRLYEDFNLLRESFLGTEQKKIFDKQRGFRLFNFETEDFKQKEKIDYNKSEFSNLKENLKTNDKQFLKTETRNKLMLENKN